uniref:Senescence-associated protein n=1 Tax=Populus alba TaxID=43335 RepID=A0A4U5N854_POPAL|nr:hypothetical protein D5086_0000275620 [Populus alba]
MTTGRINQVAFLGDTTTRTIPDADETRGRDGRGSRSYRARAARTGRSQGRRPPRRHRVPHPKARATARGPVRRGFRSTGTRAPLLGSPRAPGEARGGEGQLHIQIPPKWVRSTGTPPRRKAPRALAESDGGSRPTVRCTSTEPADTDSPITAHATLRTRDNNPDERTTATRANGNTRERSCPHRWTRKDLEGTSNTPLGDAKDLEGTSNKPRGTRGISKGHATSRGGRGGSRRDRPRGGATGTIIRGAICLSSEDGGQASAAGTSRRSLGMARRASTLARAQQLNAARPRGTALLAIPKLSAPWHEGNPVKAPHPRPRISSPNAPNGLERVTAAVAGIRTSPLRSAKPLGALGLPAPWHEGNPGFRPPPPGRRGKLRGARQLPAPWNERGLLRPHAHAADKQPQRAQRLGAGPGDGGQNRDVAPSRWARWGCLLPRISSPNAPNGLERVTGTVAGIVTSRQAVGRVGAAYWLARALANQSACAPAAADKQPQRAQRLGAGHRDGGRNRDVAPSRWARWGCLLVGTSAGKSDKATLPLTIPRRVFKSSAKDSTRRSVGIVLQGGPRGSFAARAWPTARASGAKRPLLQVGNRTAGARVASSPDSDLEAFSHNPTHGSFAPLAFQPSAMTNCANQRFLSKSRHRRIKKQRRYERLAATSQLSCGNFSDTSSFKFRRSKGSIGHAFTVRIRTGNQNQTSFYPFVPHEISVLVELILGHLRYLLTDVPPQPNSPPDNVFRPDRAAEAALGPKRGAAPRLRFTE